MIKLNLVVIRTEKIEVLAHWYSKTFDLEFVAEKHEDGILHYSAQLNEGLIEIYPSQKSSTKITFGIAVDKAYFEQILLSESPRIIDKNLLLIKDFDGNSIILSLLD
ncbi:MAG: hypothetical protein HC846_10040 [Blastocatellia bacterium]|nr:hypothetical protein [Blastocatellia bacterium]